MIQIELTPALALYSLMLALVIGAIWVYTELSVRRPQRSLGKQFLWRCTYCGYTYLDQQAQKISKCPRCESLNTVEESAATQAPADTSLSVLSESPSEPGRNTSKRKRHHQRRRGPRRRR